MPADVTSRFYGMLSPKCPYRSSLFINGNRALADNPLGNHILRMYVRGGKLQEAMDVFTRVGNPDAFMWFSIISAHAKHGKPNEAIKLYCEMRITGVKADAHVYVGALQACALAADLERGRQVHCDVLHNGIVLSMFVGNCLVDMYAKCGELEDARRVFDSLATKGVVTWNALLAGYTNHGLGQEALALYGQMEQEGLIAGNNVTFACLLKACGGAKQKGRQLHTRIVEAGQVDNVRVGNGLVDMYAKCGELEDVRRVFDSLASKTVVTWTHLWRRWALLFVRGALLYAVLRVCKAVIGSPNFRNCSILCP